MEARFKMRISRMFRSSFGSCRTRDLSDVTETPTSIDQNLHKFDMLIDSLPPKARPLPSICKPKCHEKTTCQTINNSIIPRQKVSCRYPPFVSGKVNGRACRPVFPMFPLDPFYKELRFKEKKKRGSGSGSGKNKKSKKNNAAYSKSATTNRRDVSLFSSTSQDSAYFEGSYWFSSEEDEREDESDTLFSTRSTLSNSDSSRSLRYHKRSRSKKQGGSRRRKANTKSSQVGVLLDGKVKDSFAVVKSSSDPYSDFRTSMVEMIVEKQIFAAEDLEQLLQCFLSLNSDRHHRIIIEVFTEIWETLFSSWY